MAKRILSLCLAMCFVALQLCGIVVSVVADDLTDEFSEIPMIYSVCSDVETVGDNLLDVNRIAQNVDSSFQMGDYTITVTYEIWGPDPPTEFWKLSVRLDPEKYYVLRSDDVRFRSQYTSFGLCEPGKTSSFFHGRIADACVFRVSSDYPDLCFSMGTDYTIELYEVKSFNILGDYDSTDVYDDLIVNGKLDVSQYAFATGDRSFVNVVTVNEAYYNAADQNNYGLYFYLYNPSGMEVKFAKIDLAVSWDASGNPTAFRTYMMSVCSAVSGHGSMDNGFVKLKVLDHSAGNIETVVNPSSRVYQFNKIYVRYADCMKEYEISNTFRFTGSESIGSSLSSTKVMTCDSEEQTVYIDIDYTYYRTDDSSQGAYYHNQVDSIYFNVPNWLENQYGKLTNVKLSYNQCRTKPIIVTDEYGIYKNYLESYCLDPKNSTVFNGIGLEIADRLATSTTGMGSRTWGWSSSGHSSGIYADFDTELYWVFWVEDADLTKDTFSTVDRDALEKYMYNYPIRGGTVAAANGNVSAELFESINTGVVIDTQSLNLSADGYATSHNFFEEWANFGFIYACDKENELNSLDLTEKLVAIKKESQISNRSDVLYYNKDDETDLRMCFRESQSNDSTMYLCRFNVSQYYCLPVEWKWDGSGKIHSDQMYMAQQDVYLDLHVLQMDFTSDQTGLVTVVPVTSNHIDAIPDVTLEKTPQQVGQAAAQDFWESVKDKLLNNPVTDFLKIIGFVLGAVAIAVLSYFLVPILKPIFSAISKRVRSIIDWISKKIN